MAYENDVYNAALSNGMPSALALLIVAQAKHETNNFTSSLFQDCNNAFGYGYGSDWCGNHNYIGYNSVSDSVNDVTDWIKNHFTANEINTIKTPLQYATALRNHYYYTDTVTNYANGLAKWFTSNLGTIATVSAGGLLIGLGLFYLLFRKQLHIYKKDKTTSFPSPWKSVYSKEKF